MKRRILSAMVILFPLLILNACSIMKTQKPTIENPKDQIDSTGLIAKRTFYTKDGKTKFVVSNDAKLKKADFDRATKQLNTSYNEIVHYFKNPTYKWAKSIAVSLKEHDANKISYGLANSIVLYNKSWGTPHFVITHELTHSLLGYCPNCGYLTQEGLAVYLQDADQKKWKEYGLPIDKVAKYLIMEGHSLPITKLASENSNQFFRDNNRTETRSYIEAGSFVGFLIKRYGREKFYQIYNQPDLPKEVQKVYHTSLTDLANQWISYLKKNVKLTKQEEIQIYL